VDHVNYLMLPVVHETEVTVEVVEVDNSLQTPCVREQRPPLGKKPTEAQRNADGFTRLPMVRLFDRRAKTVNPLLKNPLLQGPSYYWTTTQSEYSPVVSILFSKFRRSWA
jgi:hypothetical protein